MLRCELCGREIRGVAYKVVIDRAEMIVCSRCARGRTVVKVINFNKPFFSKERRGANLRYKPKVRREIIEEIVEDYAQRIKEARERMGLTRELLATMVGEKESTIRRIEAGTLQPTINLAKKLEKVLKIKLIEVYEEEDLLGGEYRGGGEYELTLGDIVEFKEK
ncbi:MAG: TIGR00270 family protein [Thermoprotei archaeon]|nr:MAG: TIGR00270 family protein [Thermoprotei archaeon]